MKHSLINLTARYSFAACYSPFLPLSLLLSSLPPLSLSFSISPAQTNQSQEGNHENMHRAKDEETPTWRLYPSPHTRSPSLPPSLAPTLPSLNPPHREGKEEGQEACCHLLLLLPFSLPSCTLSSLPLSPSAHSLVNFSFSF